MADIRQLARSAKSKLDKGDALTVPDAISKAIRGVGITHRGDHKRLMSEVGSQYRLDRNDESRKVRRAG